MPRSSTFFSPPSKSFPSPSILLLRAVETFLRNNNNDYVFLPRYETIYSQFTVFQYKKKKLNRRENERKIRMKELFYLEAKRERGAAKSNFDKFKSNLNDRLQFCSKTKGGGWRKKKEWKEWFYLSREDYGVRKRKVLRRLLTDRYWFPVKSTGTVTEATSGSDNFHWNIRANLFLVNINDNIRIYI